MRFVVRAAIAAMVWCVLLPPGVQAEDVPLRWDAPVDRADGTPLGEDLAGYRIFYGLASGVYDGSFLDEGPSPVDVPLSAIDVSAPSFTMHGSPTCAHPYIVMTASGRRRS